MGALDGLKILDFTTLLPGPYATLMLADLGAEVLKISMEGKPDLVLDNKFHREWLGRNKKTMFLNLKEEKSKQIIKKLIMDYDILIEQNRPGTMEKLGLGYDTLSEINPRLIYCSLTGYGQTGPLKDRAGHDINYISLSGVMSHSGKKDIGPVLTDIQIADLAVGSMNSVVSILAAVQYRNRTNEGQFLDVSMLDGMIPFNSLSGNEYLYTKNEPKREGEWLNGGGIYDFYETSDKKYLSVGSLEPKFWSNFCNAIGIPSLDQNKEATKQIVKDIIKTKTQKEWVDIFSKTDACVEPVLSVEEALASPQVMARKMVIDVPTNDGKTVKQMACPIKMSKSKAEYKHVGYPLGYNTEEILKKYGY